jgi:LmbE family N-acetylglucosaminyl deacetylase
MSDGQEREIRKVMVVGAHPDDPEFGCAATIAKWASMGREIHYVLFTSGDKGSHDPTSAARPGGGHARARAACRSHGAGPQSVTFPAPAGRYAGEHHGAASGMLCGLIPRDAARLMLAIDPWRRYLLHPDHRAAGQLALDAAWAAREWYLFRSSSSPREWRGGGGCTRSYLYWNRPTPITVDVQRAPGAAPAALVHHASQWAIAWRTSPIAHPQGAAETGGPQGMPYAEGFTSSGSSCKIKGSAGRALPLFSANRRPEQL